MTFELAVVSRSSLREQRSLTVAVDVIWLLVNYPRGTSVAVALR